MSARPAITVALVGNPNTGKSTLFNALSGLRQHVGNYAGVTVEMMKGHFVHANCRFDVIDLPGTYSLAARSPDEMVAVDLLLGRRADEKKPDVILSIVDASNLDRHLYLTTQLMELGVPVVLAVNLIDVAAGQGIRFDVEKLSQAAGLTVVPIQANKGIGLDDLKKALHDAAAAKNIPNAPALPTAIESEVAALRSALNECPVFLARRLLLDVGGSTEAAFLAKHGEALAKKLEAARVRLAEAGHPIPAAEAKARYAWVRGVIGASVQKPRERPRLWTDRLDRILTHKLAGTLIFLAIMFGVFQAIFLIADPAKDAVSYFIGGAQEWVKETMSAGPLRGLIVDGVLGGVGSIIVFLPQILILFGFLAVLEDCGYMARAAFLMDKLMSRCGLSGKSFIPMLSSVACAVPGIMATRVIENRRDRLATILVAPLMSCSARLPVYTLLIGAFLGTAAGYPSWVSGLALFGMYMIGFIVTPLMAMLFKSTLLRGAAPAYVMELPLYKRPSMTAVLRRMLGAGGSFLKRAGTFILAAMILVWAATYFPHTDGDGQRYDRKLDAAEKEKDKEAANLIHGEWQRQSYLGRAGLALEPAFTPLGWDWKIGMATLASFPAREVIVGTLGIVYNLGPVEDEQREELGQTIREDWKNDPIRGKYGIPVAVSVMVFFALCCQCASTLAVIRRETKSWAWPAFTFAYMTGLAYAAALATFQIGRLIVNTFS
jgi:ferrous iron transport protein B